jgi:hypothetical protein
MWLDDTGREVHMATAARFIISGIVFLLTLASGVWLSRSGKPLNAAIFTAHKLIALGAVIAAAVQTYNALNNAEIEAILIVLLIVIGLCAVALFVTGALMSANKPVYPTLLTIHRIAPVLALIAGAVTIYLLVGGT